MLGFTFGERELAMKFDLGGFAPVDCWLQFLEISQVYSFPTSVDVNLPSFISLLPYHASMTTFVIFESTAILHTFITGHVTKIVAAIVKRIAVLMIDLSLRIGSAKDKAVHKWTAVTGPRVKRFGSFVPLSTPRNNDDAIIFNGINGSNLPFCEANEFDSLILRLNNRLAVDALLGHDLTSNEIAVFDRFSILPELAMQQE
jgi:hypothetical protein